MNEIGERIVKITADQVMLDGNLRLPAGAQGIVLFAHGSGSSRFSSRNRYVADVLHEGGLATLLFDLLTRREEEIDMITRELRFNIDLLTQRVVGATDWLLQQPHLNELNIGYFGSSTGAAAALMAAAQRPRVVQAVVSRGGRPDLAAPLLPNVRAPTLLIVGGDDGPVIEMNRTALDQLQNEKELRIIPGASHLFEEPGTLEEVARQARHWFQRHLGAPQPEKEAARG